MLNKETWKGRIELIKKVDVWGMLRPLVIDTIFRSLFLTGQRAKGMSECHNPRPDPTTCI